MTTAVITVTIVFILAACILRSSEAVTCTADPTVTGCIDCTQSSNAAYAECVVENSQKSTAVQY